MLGMGIAVVAFCLTAAGVLVLAGAIYFGYWLGRGKPNPFDKLGTGDYVLWHLAGTDWNPATLRGTAYVLITREGKKSVSYVQLPLRCLRGYDNEQLTPADAAVLLYHNGGFALAEIVEKNGEHLLRCQRPTHPVVSPTEAELEEADSRAGFASATAEPSILIANQPTLIVTPGIVSAQERPDGPNGNGEPKESPSSPAQVGSL